MHDHFLTFIRLLNEEEVEYVVTGGYAVAKYGYPRYTGDLDIFVNGQVLSFLWRESCCKREVIQWLRGSPPGPTVARRADPITNQG